MSDDTLLSIKDDGKVIQIPGAATPPKRAVHADVKPVKMKATFMIPGLDYKRAKIALKMSPQGTALMRQIGEADYGGDPAREGVNALHALAEVRQLVPKDGPAPLDVRDALIIEAERIRHFNYIAGIEAE